MVAVKNVGVAPLFRRIWRMVTCRPSGPDYEFEVSADPPLIYLDHWALRRLSENLTLGARFLGAFARRGTVMFSLMNVAELARDASPHRANEVRDFLERLGPYWIPMTIDPLRILGAEERGETADGTHPCLSVGFLTEPAFAARLTRGAVSLAHVVDLTRRPDGDDLIQTTNRKTAELRDCIQKFRDAYVANPKELDKRYPFLKFDAAKPMRGIYNALVHYTITDTFTLNDNHARDLYHAIASVRCAQMVTLDAHWAGQVGKLKLPPGFVKVYSEAELDAFLVDLEAAPVTR
ncbi:hypothetical protein HY522_03255 [bacterium]|nr:hypothetical protein [bacterium]